MPVDVSDVNVSKALWSRSHDSLILDEKTSKSLVQGVTITWLCHVSKHLCHMKAITTTSETLAKCVLVRIFVT